MPLQLLRVLCFGPPHLTRFTKLVSYGSQDATLYDVYSAVPGLCYLKIQHENLTFRQ